MTRIGLVCGRLRDSSSERSRPAPRRPIRVPLIPLAVAAALSASPAQADYGFIRDPTGAVTLVGSGVPNSINSSGEVTGVLATDDLQVFLRSPSGAVSTFSPGGGALGQYVDSNSVFVNNGGQVAGQYYGGPFGSWRGFFRDAAGTITTFDAANPATYSGGGGTFVFGLNNLGQVIGTVITITGGLAYIRDATGAITTFSPNGANNAEARAINDAGQVAGEYYVLNADHGFIRNPNGQFTYFDVPGSPYLQVTSMNQGGAVVGIAGANGFLRDPSGTITTINVPGALTTVPVAINDLGVVAGVFEDSINHDEGFLRDASGSYTTFSVLGLSTGVTALNNAGQVTGVAVTPVPEPSSLLLLALGSAAFAALKRGL
jgi:hypothetical protein